MLAPSLSRWLALNNFRAPSPWHRLFASVHMHNEQLHLPQSTPRSPSQPLTPIVCRPNSTMASAARFERLRKLVQRDLDALPDRSLTDPIVSDSDTSGGIALEAANVPFKHPEAVVQPQPASAPITTEQNTDRRFVLLKDADSSYHPKSVPNSTATPKPTAPLPPNNLNRGDLGSATQHYSPIVALSRYPYKWYNKTHSQDIASAFFDLDKFWAREWDLYVPTSFHS